MNSNERKLPFETQILKNVISVKEKEELSNWILKNKDNSYFSRAGQKGTIRQTTRFTEDVEYPKVALEIKERIRKKIGIKTDFNPKYKDGMVASYGFEHDSCSIHTDPTWYPNHITYHCVVLLSAAETGGIPVLDKIKYPIEEGDGLFYAVSEIPHGTTLTTGEKPRMIWIFGYSIPLETN